MTRRKPNKRKYTVVRADISNPPEVDRETRKKIASTVLNYVVPALIAGLAMIRSPTLGWLVVFVCLTICWFLATWGRIPWLTGRSVKCLGYGLIGIAAVILSLFPRGSKPQIAADANQPATVPPSITATASNSPGTNVIAIGKIDGDVNVHQSANREATKSVEEEKVSIEFQGGVVCGDYETRFGAIPSFDGPTRTIIVTRWPIIVSNNTLTTISFTAYEAISRIRGKKRNIETHLLDGESKHISLPINVKAGESTKLFLIVPVHVIDSVHDLIRNVPAFSGSFTPDALNDYLDKNHGIDLYGNSLKYAEKAGGSGPDRVAAHLFHYNEDGTLAETAMQADQVTVTFRTARGNYFSARALYYDQSQFKPPGAPLRLPRGRPAKIPVKLEGIDSLPRED